MTRSRAGYGQDERGFGLFLSLLLLLLLSSLASASLVYSSIELRSAVNTRTGDRAFNAGEAGVLHALSVMNTTLVWDFQRQASTGTWTEQPWLMGTAWFALPDDPSASYQIQLTPDAADPINRATIVALGRGPLESARNIRVRLRRSGVVAAPGAVYLVNEAVSSNFRGNAFAIDGNDHRMDGTPATTGIVRPGISTRNDTVTSDTAASLNQTQKDNVRGLGFSPATATDPANPSILPASGPTATEMETLITDILARSNPVVTDSTNRFNGNCSDSFGTVSAPQVTHLTSRMGVRVNGDFCGAGILIVDGEVNLSGSMNFTGWILARGGLSLTGTGNATISGSMWTNGLDFGSGGSLQVLYSTEALELANGTGNMPNGNVPRKVTVLSWEDIG